MMLKLNVLELEKSEYTGGKSSLCPGCGHDQISNNIIQAAWENGIQPEKIAKMSGTFWGRAMASTQSMAGCPL
jgi:2-oxoglutarate ferredoxin oxidoreductase subunit beta